MVHLAFGIFFLSVTTFMSFVLSRERLKIATIEALKEAIGAASAEIELLTVKNEVKNWVHHMG